MRSLSVPETSCCRSLHFCWTEGYSRGNWSHVIIVLIHYSNKRDESEEEDMKCGEGKQGGEGMGWGKTHLQCWVFAIPSLMVNWSLLIQDPLESSHNISQLISEKYLSEMRREMMITLSSIKEKPNCFVAALRHQSLTSSQCSGMNSLSCNNCFALYFDIYWSLLWW